MPSDGSLVDGALSRPQAAASATCSSASFRPFSTKGSTRRSPSWGIRAARAARLRPSRTCTAGSGCCGLLGPALLRARQERQPVEGAAAAGSALGVEAEPYHPDVRWSPVLSNTENTCRRDASKWARSRLHFQTPQPRALPQKVEAQYNCQQ